MIDLSVRGLVKGFEQGNDIIKRVSHFDVNAGERVGILGRNGCGKTTFFRIPRGELQPDAGTVSIASGRRLGADLADPGLPRRLDDGGRAARGAPAALRHGSAHERAHRAHGDGRLPRPARGVRPAVGKFPPSRRVRHGARAQPRGQRPGHSAAMARAAV